MYCSSEAAFEYDDGSQFRVTIWDMGHILLHRHIGQFRDDDFESQEPIVNNPYPMWDQYSRLIDMLSLGITFLGSSMSFGSSEIYGQSGSIRCDSKLTDNGQSTDPSHSLSFLPGCGSYVRRRSGLDDLNISHCDGRLGEDKPF